LSDGGAVIETIRRELAPLHQSSKQRIREAVALAALKVPLGLAVLSASRLSNLMKQVFVKAVDRSSQ